MIQHVDTFEQMAEALSEQTAVVVLRRATTEIEELRTAAKWLGSLDERGTLGESEIDIRDIRHTGNAGGSVALSSAAHPLHTDGTFEEVPPTFVLLQVVHCDAGGGGISMFADTRPLVRALGDDDFTLFSSARVSFTRYAADDTKGTRSWNTPIVAGTKRDYKLRWRRDAQVLPTPQIGEDASSTLRALKRFEDFVTALPEVHYLGTQGDIIVANNNFSLHGRSALSIGGGGRHVRRAWVTATAETTRLEGVA